MVLGTHNSATYSKLIWWLRPFAWILNLTSRCQNRTIKQQLEDGVRLFNLQVCKYKGDWYISHGLCIYEQELFPLLKLLRKQKNIIIQLYLDENFWVKQDQEEFVHLVGIVKRRYCSPDFILQKAWIQGTNKYPHKTSYSLNIEECYWNKKKSLLPLLKQHAKKYNKQYIDNCKSDYLMLDYYNIC